MVEIHHSGWKPSDYTSKALDRKKPNWDYYLKEVWFLSVSHVCVFIQWHINMNCVPEGKYFDVIFLGHSRLE